TDGNSGNNYSYTFVASTNGVISQRAITVTAVTNTKTYDGDTSSAATPTISPAGSIQTGDTANFSESYDNKNAGSGKTLTPSGTVSDGNSGNNYSYSFVSSTNGVINQRAITVTAAANTKTYDGTTSAAASPTISPAGSIQTGDTANFSESYDNRNAGSGKTLTPSGIVSDGNSGNNYSYSFVSSTNGGINQRAITVTAAANSKTYDGTTSAAATPTISPAGSIQTGDTANLTESYDNKNARSRKTLTPSGTVSDGNSGNNYSYTFVASSNGVISQRAITVTAVTNTKTYDGTTSAAATPTISPAGSIQTGDTANFSESYDNRDAGSGKTLIPAGSVSDGNSGLNYAVTFVDDTTGVLNQRPITVTAATNTKTYDGNTTAAATPTVSSSYSPAIAGGDTADFSESYDNRNVGSGKTLTPPGTVSDGNSANNYSYTFVSDTTGVINQRAITVTAVTNSKTYDGTTSAAATPTVSPAGSIQTGDTANFTESYDNKNAGSGKTLTP